MSRVLAAEALGTALLVAAVIGSGIMADRLTDDVALCLLANTIATGAALLVLISTFAPISGAEFNPVVTLVMALRGKHSLVKAALVMAAQVLGGVMGAMLAHAMFDLPLLQASDTVRTGFGQWLAEAVASSGLILVILAALHGGADVARNVALYITAAYWFTASTSFANPAVTLARAFSDTFAGISLGDVPGFVLAQVLGGLVGLALGLALFPPKGRSGG